MNRLIFCLLHLFIATLFTGCHYQFGYGEIPNQYQTISVPYIEGDVNGQLTTEVIHRLSTSGGLTYLSYGGDLILKIKLLDLRDENIGFRYDRNKRGHLKKSLVPTETRLIAVAELVVIEAATKKVIRGPTRISAWIDFDHDFYSSRNSINVFSLGQLTDVDEATDTATHPLNQRLAEKISDYIINSW